ncbi:MAG: hypothetical protein ABWZ77_05140 [Naasia sp.]
MTLLYEGPTMTIADLRDSINEVKKNGNGDPESSHGYIDSICESVIEEIANGNPAGQEMARIVLELLRFEENEKWTRWYA